ncbi:hypothetical protein NE237_032901 [Protea cynaroides]|uniref:Uncharacterized protein n=1 Tax=Protea cynaroides TaxID=273540 RepID=A0A9Q0R3U1_9MAGN|nr:hypothetical protein NE237_032901 [Protea cynaroides]
MLIICSSNLTPPKFFRCGYNLLDVYSYDYLVKRNLQASAKAFQAEGKVSSDPVAIDAPGGFLFEWWSVFWDIFIARTNEKHSEVAASYIEGQRAIPQMLHEKMLWTENFLLLQQLPLLCQVDHRIDSANSKATGMVEDHQLADVAAVSAGNDYVVGNIVADALQQVGRKGVVTIEKGNSTENSLQIVEGMQFDRGWQWNSRTASCFWSTKNHKPEGVVYSTGWNKLKGVLKEAAIKAPTFGERRSHYLDDIAILTGGTVVRDEMGLTLEKVGKEVLGTAVKVVITKDSTLIVTDGNTQPAVEKRVLRSEALLR